MVIASSAWHVNQGKASSSGEEGGRIREREEGKGAERERKKEEDRKRLFDYENKFVHWCTRNDAAEQRGVRGAQPPGRQCRNVEPGEG